MLTPWKESYDQPAAAAAAKSLQACLTLCDTIDGSPPGSPIPGILQARTLEWVAISFSNLDNILKSRDITLPKKVYLVKAMVFPVAWRIPGMGEPGGLLSMGSHRVGHD